ncbi:MAG: Unknown protein [uncultured Sulfurovum sp.]|uniref:Murein L,D-transpeptidase catalytic domain family protein n=1 Tax=uncultured Sulfurovum sp. TaxID=269237 RepID=A0A6S6T079_9BACT|nr:MAG: Unknown protein [uncultured Sulfurovum sp.]
MKSKLILLSSLLFLSINTCASSTYKDIKYGSYVSIAHLKYIYNKVKRTSSVSEKALAKTFHYYEKNRYAKYLSPNYLAIADYTKFASQKRLFIINLHTGEVNKHLVAHGLNSGARGDRVWSAGNQAGSYKTPTGFFKVGYKEGITFRKKYDYLGLDGLEWKNRNAKQREIILHTASYVGSLGRSHGCFAIEPKDKREVFSRMKSALLFSYVGA